jgi:N-methylhydantoinase B
MAIDRVTLEVLRNYYQAIVEDMARIMERTAYTTFVKETADFSTGLVAMSGEYVAYPWKLGVPVYLGTNMIQTIRYFDHYDEGDIIICNDPYLSGPLATHLPDVHILRPIFHQGQHICWGYSFLHASDVGGAVPASVWPRATEIFQEGLRMRPIKLYRAGELNQDVLHLILDNSRIPEMYWGDIKAMCASVNSCDRRVQDMIRKFGLETFVEGMDAVLDYAERRARAVLANVPDGTYEFSDYLEDDLQSEVPVRIKVKLTVAGDEVHLDFSGSDPQVGSALNLASLGVRHPFLCLAIVAYIVTLDPQIPKASSIVRPIRITAPPGTVMNCEYPASIGVRFSTAWRASDTVLGALSQAVPGVIPAAPAGGTVPIVASVLEPLSGKRHVQVVEPMKGGGGGRNGMDGVTGCDSASATLRNTPVEIVETEVPIVMRSYEIIPDSGGPGQFRGGLGVKLEFQVFHPDAMVTARGMERFKLEPWGIAGGRAGMTGSCVINRGTERANDVGKVDLLRLQPGDTVSMYSPSGGGYGDPLLRDPQKVLLDYRSGWVTASFARQEYGVVIERGALDLPATERLRASMLHAVDAAFDFGPGRRALEQRWPPALQDATVAYLETLPPSVRDWGKHQIYDHVQEVARLRKPTLADVDAAWARIQSRLARIGLGGSG